MTASIYRAFAPSKRRLATAIHCIACAPLSMTPLFAAAETVGIEEVTVTAERRSESLQNTPIAITALTADALREKGITSYEGIARNSPSINFTPYPSSNNTLILFMRGQGVADPQQITQDGSVGLYVDGIYIARPQASTFDLADVERVEVLRGPQGTLYGRNTTGGAVNIISTKPTGEFGFKQDLSYGSYNAVRSLTTVDLPRVGDVSAKFTYLYKRQDGTVENPRGNNDYNFEAQNAGRFALRWQPADNVTADYSLEIGRLDSTPIYYQNPSIDGLQVTCDALSNGTGSCPGNAGYTYRAKDERMSSSYRGLDLPESDAEFQGHTLTLAWDVSSNLTLKSLTGYRDLHSDAFQNYAETFGVPYSTYDRVDSHQFSQEFQAIGDAWDQIKYVGGLYYFNEAASHFEFLGTATAPAQYGGMPYLKDRFVHADARSEAAYGQVTWTPLTMERKTDITLGGRFTRDKRKAFREYSAALVTPGGRVDMPLGDGDNDKTYTRFNGALTVAYRFTDDINAYAKVSTGYKAGGSGESVPDFSETFKPEDVTNYELGLKSYWWDHRVRANFAAFRTQVKDLQMAFPTTAQDPSTVLALNAGRAELKGIEVDLLIQPVEDLSLSLEYTGLYNRITEVDPGDGNIFSGLSNAEDYFRISNSPKNKVTLAADYTFLHFDGGSVSAYVNYRWTDSYYGTQPTGTALQGTDQYQYPSYGIMDARLNLSLQQHWRFGVWGKNIFDKRYPSFVIGNPDPVNGLVAGGYTSQNVAWADPATYGVDLSYRY